MSSSSINQSSVFIPRVFTNISKRRISEIFDKLDLAVVDHIDLVRKHGPNGDYNSAYVHLKYWLKTDSSRRFRDNLFNSKDGAKLVYDDPWFWLVLPNTSGKPVRRQESIPTRGLKKMYKGKNVETPTPSQSSVPVPVPVPVPVRAPIKITPEHVTIENMQAAFDFIQDLERSLTEPLDI